MSARKPLARMESSITTESSEKEQSTTDTPLDAETKVKTSTTENGGKSEIDIKCEMKEIVIKQEKPDVDEVKRVTRNSPTVQTASPFKKNPSDSQEQDSATESIKNEPDEATKEKKDKPITSRGRPSKSSSPSIAPTNRLTRKSAMKDWAANTRLTRARRVSAGITPRPETPPRKKNVSKKQQVEPAAKRKRSISPKNHSEEPEAKIIKTEVPEFDLDSITIKQEFLESSEEMTSDVASDITDMFPAEPSTRISLRARKTTMCYSPTTRVTRKDKTDTRKKRQSRVRPDEDSKDSMASSTIEDDATEATSSIGDISSLSSKTDAVANGTENLTDILLNTSNQIPAAVDDAKTTEMQTDSNEPTSSDQNVEETQSTGTEDNATESNASQSLLNSAEQIDIPLSVDTTETQKEEIPSTSTGAGTSEQSNSSDKSASLSPEMVSEGVCEISVKQFYKKPEFLENNLGIEDDPKLGEIVQNVAERMDETVDQRSLSNDSIKEGELVFEDEDEEVESIGTIKNDHEEDDDANSVSTGFISPLLVEEEEEENEEQTFLNGEENFEETSVSEDVLPEEEDKQTLEPEKSKIEETEVEEIKMKESNSEEIAPAEIEAKVIISEDKLPEVLNAEDTGSQDIKTLECKAKDMDCVETETKDIETENISKSQVEPLCSMAVEEEKTKICDKSDIIKDEKSIEVKITVDESKPELPKQEQKLDEKMEVEELKNVEVDELKNVEVDELKNVEVNEPKSDLNENEETKIPIYQEENKENMELLGEAVKPEECQEDSTKMVVENESSPEEQEESPSDSSKNSSPTKTELVESSGEATTSSTTSPQSSKSSGVPRTPENDEKLRQKERHLKTLGLLTHKAADEAIMAKQKRRKFLHNLSNNSSSRKNAVNASSNSGNSTAGNGQNKSSQEYTGTLKTIIKINRQSGGGNGSVSEPKKGKNGDSNSNKASTSGYNNRRQSLKMTFQKGRGRPANTEKCGENPSNTSGEESYYTIQNEAGGATTSTAAAAPPPANENPAAVPATSNQGRKSYNRSNTLNTTDPTPQTDHQENPTTSKKDEKEEILIPEKASSFKFHPGRLCQDQCYYCSGKFGLYDTPCHVGQIKSVERQQKILSNEEKLTVDNCLCDACFRHVDRRANVPSYKKRLSVPGRIETTPSTSSTTSAATTTSSAAPMTDNPPEQAKAQQLPSNCSAAHVCAVPDCGKKAAHSLRRKSIRKSIKKSLLNFDMSATGTYLYLCDKHYEAVMQSTGCVLCKRRLGKNNMYHITTDTDRLEKALADMGIPVTMGQCTAVCKLCRYFANLLMKPPEHGKVQKIEFVKNYRKRLLQFYNIHDKKDTSQDEDKDTDKEKSAKKQKTCSTAVNQEEPIETIELPPSPTHSTGSSVEMISDGGLFSGDESSTAKKPSASASNSASNQMVLDNDVLVDYDVPMISDTSSTGSSNSTSPSPQKSSKQAKDQQSKLKAILQSVGTSLEDRNDISTALRSNPNISMRELFPGEEDLGLQFKAPFGGRSSQRTPEGWTRINTFLQYDEPTRRLWEDLQKPYGNQSSFLRHLILLEKYYRNGDLILSSNASSNATVYTQTVRNRLTSFDSRSSSPSSAKEHESRPRSLSVDKIQRQLSSNSVTIIARPKDQPKEPEIAKQKDSNPSAPLTVSASSVPNSRSILKANLGVPKGNSSIEIVSLNSTPSSQSNSPQSPNRSGSTTPNEGTMLTKQQKILAAANKLMSNKRDASPTHKKPSFNTTPPELISLNKRPAPPASSLQQQMKRPLLPKPMKPLPPNVVVLPETLTAQERLESKSWRPTLLPVTTSHHINNQQGPLYQTADGRRLPALVQVQSGGRPFLISIHDYNRMCILRREKLMRDQMLKGSKGKLKGPIFPPATCPPNTNIGKQPESNPALMSFNKTMQAVTAAENAAKKQRLLLGKSTTVYAPIAPKPIQTSTTTTALASATITSQTQSQSLVKPTGVSVKPISLLSSTPPTNLSLHQSLTGQALPLLKPSNTATLTGVPTNSWLWNNFPDPNQMLINGKSTATTTSTSKGPQATFTAMKQQSLLLDNSLMSKIPKSLTVIPQHKLMPAHPQTGHNISGGSITKSKE
ncbi:uncharacterized protein LOC129920317 [Episyrphus balteatus]|uniref:uncharacterized protein LOC129920317 n=1 Tax=Episyrphus balteatus TaxID=286459 RepID=UPI002486028F|nr:uncharacterized protein LOC129920317 [Episyrphus balteatus]XP_055857631.1 uncharacterized protein LOC129920317 [Episyrphus balteatus]XP_055857632.1 uncharacterized protein LOC129920317 [Episyrphus balteatus]